MQLYLKRAFEFYAILRKCCKWKKQLHLLSFMVFKYLAYYFVLILICEFFKSTIKREWDKQTSELHLQEEKKPGFKWMFQPSLLFSNIISDAIFSDEIWRKLRKMQHYENTIEKPTLPFCCWHLNNSKQKFKALKSLMPFKR